MSSLSRHERTTTSTQWPRNIKSTTSANIGGRSMAEPLEMKAPEYTKRPSQGECSLGLGRRKSEIEEYESRNIRSSEDMITGTGGFAHGPILERQDGSEEVPPTTADRPVDCLPPYLPPPSPVLARSSVENHRQSPRSSTALPARPSRYQ